MKPLTILHRLIGQVRPMTGWMILAILLGTAGFLCAILIPVFAGMALFQPGTALLWAMGICALLRGVLRYGEQACNHYIAFRLLARIRDIVFGKLRTLAPAKLEGRSRGDLISMITSDVELLVVFYAHTISPVAIAVLVSLIFVIWQSSLSWLLGLLSLLSYLCVGVLLPWLQTRRAAVLGKAYRRKSGDLTAAVLETIRGQKELRQFSAIDSRLKQLEARTEELARTEEELKSMQGSTQACTGLAVILCSSAVLAAAGWLLGQGRILPEDMLVSFLVQISSFGPVIALANLGTGLSQTLGAGERILTLLDETPVTAEVPGTVQPLGPLALDQVTFGYEGEDRPVLQDMTLDIPERRILGICGPSGCGKSTLLRLLMRFWDPQSGQVLSGNRDIRDLSTNSLRHAQGFVTQDTDLFHDTIAENLRLARPQATREELEDACRKAAIHEFILSLPQGYDTMVGELGSTLSGGERQRLGLARAFLQDGEFLFLDEPTSNLDSLNEGIILQAIDRQMRDKTVVLVTHRKSTLGFADQVLSMQKNGSGGSRQGQNSKTKGSERV